MKSVQISLDEGLLEGIDLIVTKRHSSRSAIVREALKYWIRQEEIHDFEQGWIKKLKENPEDLSDTEAWTKAEIWGEG